jgi:hypothetical protein
MKVLCLVNPMMYTLKDIGYIYKFQYFEQVDFLN